jgi:hypothetical protein
MELQRWIFGAPSSARIVDRCGHIYLRAARYPRPVRAALVRVGIDQTYGHWNAPVDPSTHDFVYIPIPDDHAQTRALATSYDAFAAPLAAFTTPLPPHLAGRATHLDPDFAHLTYGDTARRGSRLAGFVHGDLVVFYAGLRPRAPCEHRLLYAIIGVYHVDHVVRLSDIPSARWRENAHTRRRARQADDVIVRATPARSGRLRRCIPIGEWRDRSYRVRPELLRAWGGLTCRDGYLQRSAVPPLLADPRRFARWLDRQRPELVAANNPSPG